MVRDAVQVDDPMQSIIRYSFAEGDGFVRGLEEDVPSWRDEGSIC